MAVRLETPDAQAAHRRVSDAGVALHNDHVLYLDGSPPMFHFSDPDGNDFVYLQSTGAPTKPDVSTETHHLHTTGTDLVRLALPIPHLEVRVDPHLVIVAKELAYRRMTTDQTLLIFSALPDAPVRAVTPPSRLRRLRIAVRRRWPIAGPQVAMTYVDACPHRTNSSTWDETMPSKAHCRELVEHAEP